MSILSHICNSEPKAVAQALICTMLCGFFMLIGCEERDHTITEDPYAGGKAPLGVKLSNEQPSPASGYPGDTVIFKAEGLLQWCDPAGERYDFEFFLTDEKVEIAAVTENSISIVVPENISSGITHIVMKGQVFYGPKFTVLGNINVDKEYGLTNGASGDIYCYMLHSDKSGDIYLGGTFYRLNNEARYHVGLINKRGVLQAVRSTKYNITNAFYSSGDYVSSMSYFSDGKVLVSGSFTGYENPSGRTTLSPVSNITVLNTNFSLNYRVDTIINARNAEITVNVAVFNGGSEQPVIRSFVTSKDSVIAIGNFSSYRYIDYDRSTTIDYMYVYKPVTQIMRMDASGNLDEAYRRGLAGANGRVTDAFRDGNDGMVITGEFTSFDGQPANRIVKVDAHGHIDAAYMANIGSGANGTIELVRCNAVKGKTTVVGRFTEFNRRPCHGVAILNNDGTLDETFQLREVQGGTVNFAYVLDRDKVVVSGTFSKYDGVTRQGFLILDMDGAAVQHFNVPGTFSGQLYQVLETETTRGAYGLLLMGSFARFNGERVSNIIMAEVDFED